MTWREAIAKACAGVAEAEEERARVLRAASHAGLSTRQIAQAANASASTVWRWMGGEPVSGVSLDDQADP